MHAAPVSRTIVAGWVRALMLSMMVFVVAAPAAAAPSTAKANAKAISTGMAKAAGEGGDGSAPAGAKPRSDSRPRGCVARGGEIARGPLGERYCRFVLSDGGKACTDASQCAGDCLYKSPEAYSAPPGQVVGFCQRENATPGCYARVINGRAVSLGCED